MATIVCAISGLKLKVSHMPMNLDSSIGYYHPIFALPYRKLFGLYSKHCKGELTQTDSYLLFLAFLHATGQVEWKCPASLNPEDIQTDILIENNLRQLITVVELTHSIVTPRFKQPSFSVSKHNCSLSNISLWIRSWKNNIEDFRNNYHATLEHDELVRLEKKLTWYIKSGLDAVQYSAILASWAEKAGDFPVEITEKWKKIIRSCYNQEKMFSYTPAELKELKTYIEENIEPGSIHFHELYSTIKTGIANHHDFLGLREAVGYALIPLDDDKNEKELNIIRAQAPKEEPKRLDYPSDLEFLKARLKFRAASFKKPTQNQEN